MEDMEVSLMVQGKPSQCVFCTSPKQTLTSLRELIAADELDVPPSYLFISPLGNTITQKQEARLTVGSFKDHKGGTAIQIQPNHHIEAKSLRDETREQTRKTSEDKLEMGPVSKKARLDELHSFDQNSLDAEGQASMTSGVGNVAQEEIQSFSNENCSADMIPTLPAILMMRITMLSDKQMKLKAKTKLPFSNAHFKKLQIKWLYQKKANMAYRFIMKFQHLFLTK